jgi:RNA polymerase sigma-70 factor (ECF subfamily)
MTLAYYLAAADRADYGASSARRRVSESTTPDEVALSQDRLPDTPRARRDAEWVSRIVAGNRAAFAELYGEYLQSMVGFVFRIVRSLPVAEDLCADVFVAVWERRSSWTPQYGARAYLFHAARMRALNYVRNNAAEVGRRAVVAYDVAQDRARQSPSVDETLDLDRKLQAVRDILATLPEMRRRVMQLRWHEGFDITEIADVLGISRAAVDQHLSRGLRTIRERLLTLFTER